MKSRLVHFDAAGFAPFGNVVKEPAGVPTAEGAQYKFWSDIAHFSVAGETEAGICTIYRQADNELTMMERHLRTPEILIPIDAPFILPVLLDGRRPEETQSFLVRPGEIAIINAGVWHGACFVADRDTSSYFVIFRRGTPKEDVEKMAIAPLTVIGEE